MTSESGLARVDHLVWSTPDLDLGTRQIAQLTGVQPVAGGSHPGAGTHNALLPLGKRVYLEIIGPDPGQAEYRSPRIFRLDSIEQPTLVTWAANAKCLRDHSAKTFPDGQSLGEASSMSRRRTDGLMLNWELTDPYVEVDNGVVPFLIDWGETPHPAENSTTDVTLVDLQLRHPNPETVAQKLESLDINMTVTPDSQAGLIAVIDSPRGRIELR